MTFIMQTNTLSLLPYWLSSKIICLQCSRYEFDPWVGKTPWRRKWQPTRLFFFIFFKQKYLLGCVGLHCCVGFSLIAASGGCSLATVHRLLIAMAFFIVQHRLSRVHGLHASCDSWASSALAQQLWHMGLVASQHVGSSQTRD